VTLLEKLKPWQDEYGLIHPSAPGELSGNGLSYTALAVVLAKNREELSIHDIERYANALKGCITKSGLKRRPGNNDQNAWDDYASTACALTVLGMVQSGTGMLDIYSGYWWYLNNERPGSIFHNNGKPNIAAYIGRFPQVRFAFALAARRKPSKLLQFLWCHGIRSAANAPVWNQGAHRMAWLQVAAYISSPFRSESCTSAAEFYLRQVNEKFKNPRHTQVGYFYPTHPFLLEDWPRPKEKTWYDGL
jgi:hypothetical protein